MELTAWNEDIMVDWDEVGHVVEAVYDGITVIGYVVGESEYDEETSEEEEFIYQVGADGKAWPIRSCQRWRIADASSMH